MTAFAYQLTGDCILAGAIIIALAAITGATTRIRTHRRRRDTRTRNTIIQVCADRHLPPLDFHCPRCHIIVIAAGPGRVRHELIRCQQHGGLWFQAAEHMPTTAGSDR